MKHSFKVGYFLYLPITPAEEAELRALSAKDRGRRRLAWIQAQNVIWATAQKQDQKE